MKVLLLCAGYGTRFVRDVESATDPDHRALLGVPKPLLPVAGRPLISHWTDAVRECGGFSCVCVVHNERFAGDFEAWAEVERKKSGEEGIEIRKEMRKA